jgi:hypothetical protein
MWLEEQENATKVKAMQHIAEAAAVPPRGYGGF